MNDTSSCVNQSIENTETMQYTVEFKVAGVEHEVEVDVPIGMDRWAAMRLFCSAATNEMGWKIRHFVVSRVDREYSEGGGIFLTYIMERGDRSGYIAGEVWFDAYPSESQASNA